MFIFRLIKKFRIIRRFNKILLVFFRAGFSAFIESAGFGKHIHPLRKLSGQKNVAASELPGKMRKAFEDLGPVFVKFGQILSTRSDLLPPEYIQELSKLQANVAPFSYREARQVLESSLGKSVEEAFHKFETKPFASASLGQVYRAELKSGETVAVKVQRPKAKEQIHLDTEVLLTLAHILEKRVEAIRKYNLIEIIQEFRRWTLNELDYRKEATNCEIFTNFFKDDPNIHGPKVFWEYSGESVLTLEFVDCYSLADVVEGRAKKKFNKKALAKHIADSFIRQFFEYGFFHADPHPGNIFVLKDSKILFLDFGMVGLMDDALTSLGAAMFLALIQRDVENLVTLLAKLEARYGDSKDESGTEKTVKLNSLRKELNVLVMQWSVTGQAGQFTKLMSEILRAAVRNGITVPTDLSMLGKSIITLDVVVKKLDGNFSIAQWEAPMVEKIVSRKISKKRFAANAKNAALVLEDLLKKLPDSTAAIVENIESGKFGMEVNRGQLAEYEHLLNANSKINSYGTLLSAAIIASALIYQVKDLPRILGLSVAQIGLYGSLFLVLLYLISNRKKG